MAKRKTPMPRPKTWCLNTTIPTKLHDRLGKLGHPFNISAIVTEAITERVEAWEKGMVSTCCERGLRAKEQLPESQYCPYCGKRYEGESLKTKISAELGRIRQRLVEIGKVPPAWAPTLIEAIDQARTDLCKERA